MRLYLSSFRLGPGEALRPLVRPGGTVAVIMNALDSSSPEKRREWLEREYDELGALGLSTEELDLRRFFANADILAALRTFDLIWVNGGNTFVLRRAMAQSGFDRALVKLLAADEIAYGGFSAGSVVLAPTLRGLELVDDPNVVPSGYRSEVIWDGLGVLDFQLAVHYQSHHPESAAMNDVVALFQAQQLPYRTLHDGQALVVLGEKSEVVG